MALTEQERILSLLRNIDRRLSKLEELDVAGIADLEHDHSSAAEGGQTIDVNGQADAIILDADGDTTISSPTDDQTDLEVGGVDVVALVRDKMLFVRDNTPQATWFDQLLFDQSEGNHFLEDVSGTPTGWTEVDAPAAKNQNTIYSFWYLAGSSGNASWDFTKQTGIDIETLAADAYSSFQYGPILFRDGQYAADVNYYFQICGETAAAIDTTEFVRVHLWWDSANSLWKIRAQSDNGGGTTSSAWLTLDNAVLHQPLYLRVVIRNNAAKLCRVYIGSAYSPHTQTLLQSITETTTWGQVYWRINQTRGAGINDYLFIGAIDYIAGEA